MFLLVAPAISVPPVNQTVSVSADTVNTTFLCNATGYPQPDIQWMRDGFIVIDSEYYQVTSVSFPENCPIIIGCQTSSSLLIVDTKTQDSGQYTCVASNMAGTDTRMAELIVNGMFMNFSMNSINVLIVVLPILFVTHPSPQTVSLRQTATFTCSAIGYNVSYDWTIGSGSFPSKVTGIITNTLVIPDVRSSDDSTYTCVASNEGGSVSSITARLTVTGMTMIMLLGDSVNVVLVVQVYQR